MHERHLAHMTWPAAKAAAERDVPVLIPLGTLESQGRHAPMGHDHIVAERVADGVAERVDCVVAPTIPFGYSHFSKVFPGTVSLSARTATSLFGDIAESLARGGFRRLVFLNNHGLNEPILGHVADDLRERRGLVVASVFPYQVAVEVGRDLYEPRDGIFAHGGEPTTSLLMHLAPGTVTDEPAGVLAGAWRGLEVVNPNTVRVGGVTATVYMPFDELAPAGGSGDLAQAGADKGEVIFGRLVDAVTAFVERFAHVEV
jgi:creatinine amidohydrolase